MSAFPSGGAPGCRSRSRAERRQDASGAFGSSFGRPVEWSGIASELPLGAFWALDDCLGINRQVGLPAGVAHVMGVDILPIAFSPALLAPQHHDRRYRRSTPV